MESVMNDASLVTNANNWNHIAEQLDNSKFYHLYEWGLLLEKVCRHKLFYLEEEDGILPLALVKSRIFGDRLISLPFADYGGPCAKNEEAVRSLLQKSRKLVHDLNIDFLEIRSPDEQYSGIFQECGFYKREDYLTYNIPLSKNLDELWKAIGERRNKVRKAEKNDVHIKLAATNEDIQDYFGLYLETMKRLGSPPHEYQFFITMWNLFSPKHLIMPLAVYKNQCIAGGIFFLYKGVIHHAYSCSSKEHLNLPANDFILWWIIKWGSENGYSDLNLGRTRAEAGNDMFKKQWRGKPTPMFYYYLFNKSGLQVRQETKYKSLSNIWGKYLPDVVANRVGPWVVKQVG